ncbi:MAG: PhoD-like phosphatase N-terminal domain-containing protein, partial [Alphaproteobacteria bacterium]|nr:PhoD-like phosphatase N-terminal domain-containing protein [Alphaproteobacteria bacterium]
MPRITRSLRRRTMLASGTALALPSRVFAQTSDKMRPQIPFGVQSGDVAPDGAMVWSATDRPARMMVEYATTESFTDRRLIVGQHALPESDFTARVALTGLPADQTVFYRVRFLDLGDNKTLSEPVMGRFRTPPAGDRDVS